MPTFKNFLIGLMSVVIFTWAVGLMVPSPSWAEIQCGETIGPNEVAILAQDLTCPGNNPALILEAGSSLNLGGHTVDCNNVNNDGIVVQGSNAILQHGTIMNCSRGVVLNGNGGHTVTKVTAKNNQIQGFIIQSDGNVLSFNKSTGNIRNGYRIFGGSRNFLANNLAKNNTRFGFLIDPPGHDNSFTKNWAISNNTDGGFRISGNRNKLGDNLAKNNGDGGADDGFEINGNNNEIFSNKAIGNFGSGFRLGPFPRNIVITGNQLQTNRAEKNKEYGIRVMEGAINGRILANNSERNSLDDLGDDNGNCDNNQWQGNLFRTSNQDCIK